MPSDASDNKATLHPLLQRAMDQSAACGEMVLARLPAPRPARDPWDLAQRALSMGEQATIWSDPDQRYLAVGLDEALRISSDGHDRLLDLDAKFRAIRTSTHPLLSTLPLWFGGFSFDHRPSASAPWANWPSAELVTHGITAVQYDRKNYTVLSLPIAPDASIESVNAAYHALKARAALLFEDTANAPSDALDFHVIDPKTHWEAQVTRAQQSIEAGTLRKIVLARRVKASWPQTNASDSSVSARIAPALHVLRTRYRHCTTFAFLRPGVDGPSTFFGTTPELLVERKNATLYTMALAGTAPRDEDFKADEAQRQGLLASPKEREEHNFVVKDIEQNLTKMGIDVHVPSAPDVVSYPNVHHLRTAIRSKSTNTYGLLPIADALHPTPAICGTPTDTTYAWLHENEGIDRGWYAGGVMWLNDQGDGRVNVALRSAIADHSGVCAYAGAGIVEGSDALKEWDETDAKLSPICDAFGAALFKEH